MRTSRIQRDVFTHLISELEKSGVTAEQLLHQSQLREQTLSISGQAVAASNNPLIILETAVSLAGDPSLALRLGQKIDIESYGTFGFALLSCATLRESIELLLRYGKVFFNPGWLSQDHDKGLLLRLDLNRGTPAQQQIVAELCFSQLASIGNSLFRRHLEGAQISFSYAKPAHASSYKMILGAEVTFDSEHSELFLPTRVLETAVKTANISDHVIFHQQCEEMLLGLDRAEKTTTNVRQLLIQSAGDFLTIEQVAERLHISQRTLRRRLEAESTNFRSTLDEIRDLLAKEYLAKTELTVAEIAHLLEYSETVNFRRAFGRWNGIAPNTYRQNPHG
jgi:AraC-like DNA-binding protein